MSGRTGYPDLVTDKQVHLLSKLLLENGADHDDVGRVRNMCQRWQELHRGRRQVSTWIDGLVSEDPVVSGEAAMECCRKADRHHFSTLNREKRVA